MNVSNARGFREWDRFDYLLIIAALALVGYGLLLIYSGTLSSYDGPFASFSNPVAKQALFAVISIAAMLVVSRIDYHLFLHYSWVIYGATIVVLVALLTIGPTIEGSTRWFQVGPVQVQPSEFAKITVIIVLARFWSEHTGDARELSGLMISLGLAAPVALLIFIQPDLGTSIVFATVWLGMVIVAGVNRTYLLLLAAIFLAVLPFLWTFAVADYQVERISTLVDPQEQPLGAGYTSIQGKITVASGQFLGKGFTNGDQTQLSYLKVPTKDFIFSVLGEEFGFVGALVLFALFTFLLMRGIRTAQLAGDVAGQLIAVGVVLFILTQTFINVAVNLAIFPVTGLPLPFVSQGGSSMLSLFIALGLLQSIVMRHRAYRQN